MKRFVEGVNRGQSTLFPDRLEDWIGDDNPVRVIDVLSMSSILAAWGLVGLRRRRRAGRATGGSIVAMTGVDLEAYKSPDGIGARVTPIA